ncbi:MAG: hypothetical protein P8I82_06255 [Flavobacteriales bacterium]|nr:hypothetical protein [Flavobacteriales bacterium]
MRKWLLLMAMLTTTASFAQVKAKKVVTAVIQTSAVCEMCENLIVNKTLAYEKGVKYAEMDVASGALTIRYRRDKTSLDHLRAVISELGYSADSVKADSLAYENLHFCCKAPHD